MGTRNDGAESEKFMKKTYIFDFDGTLADSMPTWSEKMLTVLSELGVEYPSDIIKILTPLGDIGSAKYFREVLGVEASNEELISKMDAYALPKYRDEILLKEGVFDYLTFLKGKGISLNVLTASPKRMVVPCLERNGVLHLFENVWSSECFGKTKADPTIYTDALSRLSADASDAVFFDDNIGALKTAKTAGLYTVGVYDPSAEDFKDEMLTVADLYIDGFANFEKTF